jgi:hypothetical protein
MEFSPAQANKRCPDHLWTRLAYGSLDGASKPLFALGLLQIFQTLLLLIQLLLHDFHAILFLPLALIPLGAGVGKAVYGKVD